MKPVIQLTLLCMVAGAIFGLVDAFTSGEMERRENLIHAVWQETYQRDLSQSMKQTERALAAAEGWMKLATEAEQ